MQRRCRGEFEIKQRVLIVKERLIEIGKRVAPRANRIEQLQRGAFTSFQGNLRQVLYLIDLGNYAGPIKLNAAPLNLERDECLVHVAEYLVGNKLFLVLGFLFFDQSLGTLALIAIRDGKRYAYAESVSAGAGRNLINASADGDIGNTLSILQANGCVSSTLT